MLSIQYLEYSPELWRYTEKEIIEKLHAACNLLPISHLLIGWHIPRRLRERCRVEADKLGLRFLRWQPLLTSDGVFTPKPSWQTESLTGHKVEGYRGLPEFTFACPNHPAVQEAISLHIDNMVREGVYQGFFLDRIRFPSPATDPTSDLACFCEHCRRKAAAYGLDFGQIKADILRNVQHEEGRKFFIKSMFTGNVAPVTLELHPAVSQFLTFRKKCIQDYLSFIAAPLKEAHLEIGLDCFSPSLTNLVGQDLATLGKLVDWVKLMSYAHTFAPAGIPYELSGMLRFLVSGIPLQEEQALEWVSQTIGLPLSESRQSLVEAGLSPTGLEMEVKTGIKACPVPVLAGMELVDLEGVTRLASDQIRADLMAIKRAQPAGLAISWDLLHIPLTHLDLVRQVYLGDI